MGLPQLTHRLDALNILFHCNIREYHISNKFALLWGEAQLCPKVTYSDTKITYSYPKVDLYAIVTLG